MRLVHRVVGGPVYVTAFADTHYAYPWRDGQAELAWVAGYIQRWITCFDDGHPS